MGQASEEKIQQEIAVGLEHAGMRVDQAAAQLFAGYSRSRLQEWIKTGELTVNGKQVKAKERLLGTETLELDAVMAIKVEDDAEPIELDVVYADEHLVVINKPAGLVVHPAAGHQQGTLLNGLLHLYPQLASLPRAGIVHRLDKDTTGLMVIAASLPAHAGLVDQFQERTVHREYAAIVYGVMTGGGRVEAPLGRHPQDRKRQAVVSDGKEAITHYRVLERFRSHTLVQAQLETGRTHQIRVHMQHIRYPLVGDSVYGGRLRLPAGASDELREGLQNFRRQALHARKLSFVHPVTEELMIFTAELPEDMAALVELLQEDMVNEQ
ncbi:MAG TPA: 23S rRNA pseudouridine(1911/1915/1917) synthase RluD [Alcanivoracaceae bacterium]|nr:23S rRNA pseudouridine(1911/1915/1917) synthase RluD [Alcanivoracaceae bacterium]